MTRLEQARAILKKATQSEAHCPFMNAMPAETRAELNQEFPNPHELSEFQLFEIAEQHGFSTASFNQTPVGATLVVALPHNNLDNSKSENVFSLDVTGWVQDPPLQKPSKNEINLAIQKIPVGANLLDPKAAPVGVLAHKTAPDGLFALGSLVFALPHNNLEIPNSENVFFSTLTKQKLPSQIPALEDSR